MDEVLRQRVAELTAHLTIRRARPEPADAEAFVGLFNATYARKVRPTYYYWQFFDAAFPGVCLLVEDAGQVTATYGLRPLPFWADGHCRIGLTTDLIIAPDARRGGLMARLEMEMERVAAAEGCIALYACPNPAAYQPRITQLGWSPVGRRVTWAADTAVAHPIPRDLRWEPVAHFGLDANQIADRFLRRHAHLALVPRSAAFLNWRLRRNPWYAYDSFLVRRGGEPFGLVSLKVYHDPATGQASGDVVDAIGADEDPAAFAGMLTLALRHLRGLDVPTATLWPQPQTALEQAAGETGFAPTGKAREFCCQILQPGYEWLRTPAHWFFTMIDSEVF